MIKNGIRGGQGPWARPIHVCLVHFYSKLIETT